MTFIIFSVTIVTFSCAKLFLLDKTADICQNNRRYGISNDFFTGDLYENKKAVSDNSCFCYYVGL